mgnify:CR=1 FL=1
MMNETLILAGSAAGIGFIHTVLGPDHYLPFIAMSKARGWSGALTAIITLLCGICHITGSIILGMVGLFFGIVVFGPCEPLIPLLMYPAAKSSALAVAAVGIVFGLVTIGTMLACVMVPYYGLSKISIPHAERYSHAAAGLTVFLCGGAIKFLGL